MIVRRAEERDLGGLLRSLDSLRPASALSEERARRIFAEISAEPARTILVAERDGAIVGTATLLVERKLIHDGARAGHIEDVAVLAGEQRSGVGGALVRAALDAARDAGCYKAVLECSAELVPFYERLGLRCHSETMRIDLAGAGAQDRP